MRPHTMSCLPLVMLMLLTAGLQALHLHQAQKQPIVGGDTVKIQQYPYQAQVWYNDKYFCGASIISDVWILSSASCTYWMTNLALGSVRVGSADLEGGVAHQVEAIYTFDKFNRVYQNYNVGLIKLKDKIVFSDSAQPVVVGKDALQEGQMAVVSGFGYTTYYYFDQEDSKVLIALGVPVVSRSLCQMLYSQQYLIDESIVCAKRHEEGFCTDDEGDPLVAGGVQVGIALYSVGCGDGPKPGAYTNLAEPSIRDWIYSLTGL